MERIAITSTSMISIGYDATAEILEIEFMKGGAYQYSGVPESVYDEMMNSDSKGKYYHANINKKYPFSKV